MVSGAVTADTRVLQERRVRLTGSSHFPHRQLILTISSEAKALPGYRALIQGDRHLALSLEDYAFDTDRRELHRGPDVVSVAPQVFDLLDYLICNRERVVSKDDLINAVWNGRSVSDAALTTRLNVARSAIGDCGEEQHLIKTLPRKGFRFVGQVREAREVASPNPGGVAPESAVALPDKPYLVNPLLTGYAVSSPDFWPECDVTVGLTGLWLEGWIKPGHYFRIRQVSTSGFGPKRRLADVS